jgi:hypothetical protein
MINTPNRSGVYFFHIPKTAGTTVWKAIESAYEQELVCPWWLWDDLIDIPKQKLAQYQVFRGHFYGFLEPYLERELRKFTILRNPVDRTVSYYYYIRQLPEHPNYKHANTLSLREFCTHEETQYLVENYQAGYLASFVFTRDPEEMAKNFTAEDKQQHLFQAALEPFSLSSSRMDSDVLLRAAEEGLRQFCAVGIAERLRLSIKLISDALGCSMILPAERLNVTPERPSLDQIDDMTMETIHSITAVDRILYRRVAGALDVLCPQHVLDLDFDARGRHSSGSAPRRSPVNGRSVVGSRGAGGV